MEDTGVGMGVHGTARQADVATVPQLRGRVKQSPTRLVQIIAQSMKIGCGM
jgi:hypothetical protein